ncbi:glycosyltransferase family 4 protein [Patescibacteria group bacterium]|nr:glycosyltransferase family 4 protein [Patescibacteria group bacterium]
MLIGIDGNEANVEKGVGIGEYSFELLKKFEKFRDQNLKFVIYLKTKPLGHMPKERDGWRYKIFGPKKMWTQFALPLKLFSSKNRPNVFFSPSHYGPRFSPIPTAISIMDLSYVYFPQLFNKDDLYQLNNWTRYSARRSAKVFTISNSSRNDIIKEYKIEPEKVIVTHLGIKENQDSKTKSLNMQDLNKKFGIKGKYILFVGTLQPRKNISKLIEAFSMIKDRKDLSLVVVGKKGWMYEEILAAPDKFGVKENVLFLDYVDDSDLPSLYKNAECFVLPSLYEGFGLPILEAMKFGCPVLASNVSSLPEAGGDAAIYFDPNSAQDIAKNLESITQNPKLREEMVKKGYEQIKKFSWEKTAKQTLQALEELAVKE